MKMSIHKVFYIPLDISKLKRKNANNNEGKIRDDIKKEKS